MCVFFLFRHQIRAVDLFGGESLGIFTEGPTNQGTELKLWDYLKENELRIAVTHPPTNHFQKMILWTNRGMIWKFPIDNEQGIYLIFRFFSLPLRAWFFVFDSFVSIKSTLVTPLTLKLTMSCCSYSTHSILKISFVIFASCQIKMKLTNFHFTLLND